MTRRLVLTINDPEQYIFERSLWSAWLSVDVCANRFFLRLNNRFTSAKEQATLITYSCITPKVRESFTFRSGLQPHSSNSFKASFLSDIFGDSLFYAALRQNTYIISIYEQRVSDGQWKYSHFPSYYTPELLVFPLFMDLRIVWINYYQTKVARITTSHNSKWDIVLFYVTTAMLSDVINSFC